MISLPLPPKVTQKGKNHAIFEVQGLYPGYGVTIGNSLRRVLLSSLEGVAVTEVKIKGVPHEFSTIPGVLEDMIMIILNLKNLRFKIHDGETHKVELSVKGEKEVTGADFKIFPQIELVNPDLHIATITDKKTEFQMEITIEKGIGYEPRDQRKEKKNEIGAIAMDAIFTPIKDVSFNVESMRVGDRTDFDKLSVEIETDGIISPEEAFFEACEILIKHFTIIFEGKAPEQKKQLKSEEAVGSAGKETSIEDMKFSKRTLNVLVANKLKTAGDIANKLEGELSQMEGMGEKAITETKKKLKKLGLGLKDNN